MHRRLQVVPRASVGRRGRGHER